VEFATLDVEVGTLKRSFVVVVVVSGKEFHFLK